MCYEAFRDRFFFIPFAHVLAAKCSKNTSFVPGKYNYLLEVEDENQEKG